MVIIMSEDAQTRTKLPLREIEVRTFIHATEDEGKISRALELILPAGIGVRRMKLQGHYGNPIVLLEAKIRQKKKVEETVSKLLSNLEGGVNAFLSGLHRRIDERGWVYLRLDKQEACRGRLVPGEWDDVIHLKFRTNVFPPDLKLITERIVESLSRVR